MVTTGTYLFGTNLEYSSVVLESIHRAGIKLDSVDTAELMVSLRNSCNFLNVEWANRGVNLWTVDLKSITLVQGTSTYGPPTDVPQETIMVLDAYIRTGTTTTQDRLIYPISRSEYASYPDKTTQAPPLVFWFDRLVSPTITVWPPPDSNGPYTLQYYRQRQIQDASLTSGTTVDAPYRFLDAYCAGLAWRVAEKFNPARKMELQNTYMQAWILAGGEDRERVPIFITPDVSGYFRP